MGSYRQWATMIRHVHKAHAQGAAEEETEEEMLLSRNADETIRREYSDSDPSGNSAALQG